MSKVIFPLKIKLREGNNIEKQNKNSKLKVSKIDG